MKPGYKNLKKEKEKENLLGEKDSVWICNCILTKSHLLKCNLVVEIYYVKFFKSRIIWWESIMDN